MMLLCYSLKVLNICYIGGCSDAFKSPKYTVGEVTKATHRCKREELRKGREGKRREGGDERRGQRLVKKETEIGDKREGREREGREKEEGTA